MTVLSAQSSVSVLEAWAESNPERLLDALDGQTMRPTLLTFAAEIAGGCLPSEQVVPLLLTLLKHSHPAVREGAIYGLAMHESLEIDEALVGLTQTDESPGVREAASETLRGR